MRHPSGRARRWPAILAIGVATVGAAVGGSGSARAQQAEDPSPGARDARPIDRWLLSGRLDLPPASAGPAAHPLQTPSGPLFPDRDVVVGPGYWHLVREDGARSFDIALRLEAQGRLHDLEGVPGTAESPAQGASVLAHAYLRAPADRTIRLDLAASACAGPAAWLNGQPLGAAFGEEPVVARLAGGWNTLLVRLDEASGCRLELAAALLRYEAPDEEGRSVPGLDEVRVQASRPPGVRRNFPEPWVTATDLRPGTPIVWSTGDEELLVPVTYRLTTWGRGPGTEPVADAAAEGEGRPDEPPAVDLSGEWELRLFSPIGLEEATARFGQTEDGTLRGEIRGERFSGEVRDGWVSGERFAFTTRFSARGPPADVRFEGIATGDSLRGTIDFGRLGGFESRFRGARVGVGGAAGAAGEGEGAGDPDPGAGAGDPDAPGGGPPGRARSPGFGPGARGQEPDLEALRARIRRQLLPDREPAAAAPARASVEVQIAGERIRDAVAGLQPARAERRATRAPFGDVRDAALDTDGVRLRLAWDDRQSRRRLAISPALLLRALHAPITLEGWAAHGDGWRGTWRVPRRLRGFTVALDAAGGAGAEWSVNGRPLAAGEPLCAPCREGETLEIVLSGATPTEAVRAVIVEPGYPAAAPAPDAPPARDWLRALEGDNRRYLELSRRHAGS